MSGAVQRRGMLLCLVGPAGGGKTSHGEELLKRHRGSLELSISVTSRPPRAAEQDGVHYHFVSREEFERRKDAGEFFETEEVHGNLYGTLRKTLSDSIKDGRDLLLDIDIRGALTFKQNFPRETVLVFLVPPSGAELRNRIISRGSVSEAELEKRLQTAQKEYDALFAALPQPGLIDYFVVNDDRSKALTTLNAIVEAERARIGRLSEQDLRRICAIE